MATKPLILEPNDCYVVETRDKGVVVLPRITRILSELDSKKSKQRLEEWHKNNPGKQEEAQNNGTLLHHSIENYFLHGEQKPDPEISEYWNILHPLFRLGSNPIWAEKHLKLELPFLYSLKLGFAGTPDLILNFNHKLTLVDIKTSSTLYVRWKPEVQDYKMFSDLNHPDRDKYFPAFYGWKKWEKVKLQLVAYSLAWKELFNIRIPQTCAWIAYVPDRESKYFDEETTPKSSHQLFTLTEYEYSISARRVKKALNSFYEKNPQFPSAEDVINIRKEHSTYRMIPRKKLY